MDKKQVTFKNTEDNLYEHLSHTYYSVLVVTILVFGIVILGSFSNETKPIGLKFTFTYGKLLTTSFLTVLLAGLIWVLSKKFLSIRLFPASIPSLTDTTFIAAIMLITLAVVVTHQNQYHHFSSLIIIPVLICTFLCGKNTGVIAAMASLIALPGLNIYFNGVLDPNNALQDIVTGLVALTTAWFTGQVLEITQQLHQSTNQHRWFLQLLLDKVPLGLASLDERGKTNFKNRRFIENQECLAPLVSGDKSFCFEHEGKPIKAASFSFTEDNVKHTLVVQEDLSQQAKLVEVQAQLAALLDTLDTGLIYANTKGYVDMASRTARNLLGDGIIGSTAQEINHLFGIPENEQEVYKNHEVLINNRYLLINRTSVRDKAPGEMGVSWIVEDITAQKEMQAEMARMDRLQMVGEMAAGMGHEIRNPLTSIKGFLQLLKDKKGNIEDFHSFFDLMIGEVDRANNIITEYLLLASKRPTPKTELNLNDIIRELLPLLQAEATIKNIEIRTELNTVPNLLLNKGEIRQLLINLVRNGLDASEEGKALTIRTGKGNNDNEVILAVIDQGEGIDPKNAPKVGTPFFTTKATGTGLGLAVCHGIAQNHKARIDFESKPGEGTIFTVTFKVANNHETD
ncbi:MAG: hypothetical protein H0Z39_09915 [Peptococcaceae bacterium]|nr:hypothetical protein [Peptococcaceae bacterium]